MAETNNSKQPNVPDWNFGIEKMLKQIDAMHTFTKEAAINSSACALYSANAATFAEKSERFSQECKDQIEESKEILKKQGGRSWWQLVIALLTCIGIMVTISFFINSSNVALIEAYNAAAKAEVDAQNKNQVRLEKELDELKNVLKTALEQGG